MKLFALFFLCSSIAGNVTLLERNLATTSNNTSSTTSTTTSKTTQTTSSSSSSSNNANLECNQEMMTSYGMTGYGKPV